MPRVGSHGSSTTKGPARASVGAGGTRATAPDEGEGPGREGRSTLAAQIAAGHRDPQEVSHAPCCADIGAVNERLARAGATAWQLVGLAACAGIGMYVAGRLRLVLLSLFAALVLTTALSPIVRFLERRHFPALVATWAACLALAGGVGLLGALIGPGLAGELADIDTVVTQGVDDIEGWLVEGPLDLDAGAVADARDRMGRELSSLTGTGLLSRARALGELLTGAVLALALAFFLAKDGPKIQSALLMAVPERHRARTQAAGAAASRTTVGYARGMAVIGCVEGLAMTIALTLVGADLALEVGVITLLCAFLPFLGAVIAGVVAVLTALVTGGPGDAATVAGFALVLQQFDNELLAPLVYGRLTRLHPIVVLLSVAAGAGVANVAGAVVAVPLVAAAVAARSVLRSVPGEIPATAIPPAVRLGLDAP